MKGKIDISRLTYGNGDEFIEIKVRDDSSKAKFITVKITFEQFTRALMGLSHTPCEFTVQHLERVGKRRESMPIVFNLNRISSDSYKTVAKRLLPIHVPKGWIADNSFSSQDSIVRSDGKATARTNAYRWVENGHDTES